MAENIFHRSFQNIFSSALKGTIINDDMQILRAPKHPPPPGSRPIQNINALINIIAEDMSDSKPLE